jgi:outer membrane protein OmpA-like peptidoglycan-associated protein
MFSRGYHKSTAAQLKCCSNVRVAKNVCDKVDLCGFFDTVAGKYKFDVWNKNKRRERMRKFKVITAVATAAILASGCASIDAMIANKKVDTSDWKQCAIAGAAASTVVTAFSGKGSNDGEAYLTHGLIGAAIAGTYCYVTANQTESLGGGIMLKGVNFETGSATLTAKAKGILRPIALAHHKDNGGVNLTIEGHTDSVGDAAMNKGLSQRRAQAVRAFMVANGCDVNKLTAIGYGEEQPIADNATSEGRAANRRVELHKD